MSSIIHLDLFSGIGGFAYAIDQVWDDVEHIFCDNEPFAREVLKKHWPESDIYNDIKEITADTFYEGLERQLKLKAEGQRGQPRRTRQDQKPRPFILTGGFPCQPFSQAGLRGGTSDDRYLWPEMLRIVQVTQPAWVIAENVGGLVTWNEGMVLEQVCTDLEAEGYEVQPLIIPAVAVNAPHRRDRIWFIAHAVNSGQGREKRESLKSPQSIPQEHRTKHSTARQSERADNDWRFDTSDWDKDWMEVAAELCGVDDGLPKGVDRANQIKAYGNAIVPQVAEQIIRGIDLLTDDPDTKSRKAKAQE